MKEATRQKFQRQAEPFLNAGERVEAAVDGSSSALAYWLLGAVIYLGIGRAVLVTDKGVYVCKRNAAGLGSVIGSYPSKTVKLELLGQQLHVGAEHTIYIPPGRKETAREVVQVAGTTG